jgi:hypothetical protein
MNMDIVRIARNVNFAQLRDESFWGSAYKNIINAWIIDPCKILYNEGNFQYEHGIAVLSLELLFFEPHGKLLNPDLTRHGELFINGLVGFFNYLKNNMIDNDCDDLRQSIWKQARCGLFHSLKLESDIMIDAQNVTYKVISTNNMFNGNWGRYLINPWKLLFELEKYIEKYVNDIMDNKNIELGNYFRRGFKNLIMKPLQNFERHINKQI